MADPFPALIWDCETTGLPDFKKPADDPSQPRIVSIAGAVIETDGDPLAFIDMTVKPNGWTIPFDAARIHGITTEKAEADGLPLEEVINAFMRLWDRVDIVSSYGILFDTKLLRGELRRLGLDDHFGEKHEFCVMRGVTPLCRIAPTHAMLAANYKTNKTPKLLESCELLLGRKHEKAHSAYGDLIVTIDLYRFLASKGLVIPKKRESFDQSVGGSGAPRKPAEAQPGQARSPERGPLPAAADPFGVAS